jgi:alpha-1,6-mannosyltransferase
VTPDTSGPDQGFHRQIPPPVSSGTALPFPLVATTIERARAAVAGSPELRRVVDRGRSVLLGPDADAPLGHSEISPWRPPVAEARTRWPTVLAALAGFLGALLISTSAPVWRLAVPSWRFTLPFIPHPGNTMQSAALFVAGLILLGLGWFGLINRAGKPGDRRRRMGMVAAVIALWTLPFLVGPPLLSNDVYSYVAQGEMASQGIDPTSTGPIALGRGDWLRQVDPVWRAAPAPYGPVAIGVSEAVVEASGHNPATSVWLFRGVMVVGVAMAAVGVALIAARAGVDPVVAVAIGIGNPLVTLYLIGGIHNDALMFGFLALGLAAAQREKKVWALALLAAATAIKLPAAVALVYLGWTWPGVVATFRQRVVATVGVLATAAAGIAVACLATGVGIGWITALESTGKVTTTFSPTTKLGFSIGEVLTWFGVPVSPDAVGAGWRLFGLAATAVLGLVMMLRSPRVGIVKATGVILVAYVLLGPVLWPWYLPAGFALLAAVGLGRYRPSYLIVCVAVSWFVWPTSVIPVDYLTQYQHLLGLGVVALVTGLAFGAQRFSSRWERRLHRELAELPDGGLDERVPPRSSVG